MMRWYRSPSAPLSRKGADTQIGTMTNTLVINLKLVCPSENIHFHNSPQRKINGVVVFNGVNGQWLLVN